MILTASDILHIALYLNCDPFDKSMIPVEPIPGVQGKYILTHTRPCFFQDKSTGLCMIHEAKPKACRDYPFLMFAKGDCTLVDVCLCPEANKMLKAHFDIQPGT